MAEGKQLVQGTLRGTADSSITDPQQVWGRVPLYIYNHRVDWWMWLALATLTVASGVGGVGLLKWLAYLTNGYLDDWMKSPGPWTALIVLAGLPVGLFVWFVRDRNKWMDHWHEERRQQLQFGQNIHRRIEHAWAHFRQLQESITGGNATLQTAAIHQLRPFIMGESGGVIPNELLRPENHFISSAMAVLRALLDDRSWLENWKKEIEAEGRTAPAPKSPVLNAIESLPREEGLPWKYFAGWDLSRLDLNRVDWTRTDLRGANLEEANLTRAHLNRADLSLAELHGADLTYADLERARLFGTKLNNTIMMGVNLDGALLDSAEVQNSNLISASLWDVNFVYADLMGTKIGDVWRDAIDWERFDVETMPRFVKFSGDFLPPKPEWMEEDEAAEVDEENK